MYTYLKITTKPHNPPEETIVQTKSVCTRIAAINRW